MSEQLVFINGIFIKDMKLPKDCNNCKFFNPNYGHPTCIATGNSKGYNWKPIGQRMSDCPLIVAQILDPNYYGEE